MSFAWIFKDFNLNFNSCFSPHLQFCHFENATEGQYPKINNTKSLQSCKEKSIIFIWHTWDCSDLVSNPATRQTECACVHATVYHKDEEGVQVRATELQYACIFVANISQGWKFN